MKKNDLNYTTISNYAFLISSKIIKVPTGLFSLVIIGNPVFNDKETSGIF